jgi:hypothetical protein
MTTFGATVDASRDVAAHAQARFSRIDAAVTADADSLTRSLHGRWRDDFPAAHQDAQTVASGTGLLGLHRSRTRRARTDLKTWAKTWRPVLPTLPTDSNALAALVLRSRHQISSRRSAPMPGTQQNRPIRSTVRPASSPRRRAATQPLPRSPTRRPCVCTTSASPTTEAWVYSESPPAGSPQPSRASTGSLRNCSKSAHEYTHSSLSRRFEASQQDAWRPNTTPGRTTRACSTCRANAPRGRATRTDHNQNQDQASASNISGANPRASTGSDQAEGSAADRSRRTGR